MEAKEFDKKFDRGADISRFLDPTRATRPNAHLCRLSVRLPRWMIHDLDKEAERRGIARRVIIEGWISERLKREELARECAKLDRREEQALADEGMTSLRVSQKSRSRS